jgi:hypothetical protein
MKQLMMLLSLMSAVGCSGVKFSPPSDASATSPASVQNTDGTGDTASGTIQQGGDISNSGGAAGVVTGAGNASAADLPKLQFIGPPCLRLTNCVVTFQLDKAYPYITEFDWQTNDALYGTPAQAGLAPWGKPGYPGDATAQYVPTSGHVVFSAGSTQETVYVRNINQQPDAISIGVLMKNCVYNSLTESCQKFFNQ